MENFKHFPHKSSKEFRAEHFYGKVIEKGRFRLDFPPEIKKFISEVFFTGF
jgi:hypothetical protein